MLKVIWTILCLVLAVQAGGALADPPANDTCEDAAGIDCPTTLDGTLAEATDDDPIGSNGRDVWYEVTLAGQQYVLVRAIPHAGTNLKLEIGLFTDAGDDCEGFGKLGWAKGTEVEVPVQFGTCVPPGKYKIVVDWAPSAEAGGNLPTSWGFTMQTLCTPWNPTFCGFTVLDIGQCEFALSGSGFQPTTAWACYVTTGSLVSGDPFPGREPGTAEWVLSDASGVLVGSDLDYCNDVSCPDFLSSPARVSGPLPTGTYKIVLDNGDGIYDPSEDCAVLDVCATSGTEERSWGEVKQMFR